MLAYSAARSEGDADFELHHLTAPNAWHRCGRAMPAESTVVNNQGDILPLPHRKFQATTYRSSPYTRPIPTTPSSTGDSTHTTPPCFPTLAWIPPLPFLLSRSECQARGAFVRSLKAVVLHGIALCDHSQVGSAEWWASGVPGRHAARAGLSLAEWAERQGMVIPTPTALRDASAPAA